MIAKLEHIMCLPERWCPTACRRVPSVWLAKVRTGPGKTGLNLVYGTDREEALSEARRIFPEMVETAAR